MTDIAKKPNQKFCNDCGEIISAKAEICPKCGVRQLAPPSTLANVAPNGKSKMVAALLAGFLGGLGAHKFYLGQNWLGILYICFSWTFIPIIISLIEVVIFLTMSDEVFNQKYGNI